ncbi:MAG: DUF4390 domain-containing protein [Deltaproteobacteria bacterium]|nr:DUF4390 domain-containing protein [Deltaproteobacteria bacterium]
MMKYISTLTVFMIICLLLVFPPGIVNGSVSIHDIRILNNEKDVVVYAVLTDGFSKEMESAIMAGVPTTFTFTLKTYQEKSWWPDKKMSHVTIKHTMKYDNVKQTFSVTSADNGQEAVFSDFDAAKRAMSELSGIAVVPIGDLTKGSSYYIRMKAKLEKYRPPSVLRYIFFFTSPGDFETGWSLKHRFIY